MKLSQYVVTHTVRGPCQCGVCVDVEDKDPPEGHTLDMTFFELAKSEDADKDQFLSLVQDQFPQWLDGRERSYIEAGADIGDQGIALMTMGLGNLLGIWDLMTPDNMLDGMLTKDMRMLAAQKGLITIKYTGEKRCS